MVKTKTGTIMRSLSGFYDVQTEDGLVTCRARGHMRRGVTPLVGDRVEITVEKGKGMLEKLLPRRNSFVRPAVANLDLLVVFAANVNPVTARIINSACVYANRFFKFVASVSKFCHLFFLLKIIKVHSLQYILCRFAL